MALGEGVTLPRRDLLAAFGGLAASQLLGESHTRVRLASNWMRVSPSVYNDMSDIERLLEALAS